MDAEAVADIGNRPGQDHECQAGEEFGKAKECLAAAIQGDEADTDEAVFGCHGEVLFVGVGGVMHLMPLRG